VNVTVTLTLLAFAAERRAAVHQRQQHGTQPQAAARQGDGGIMGQTDGRPHSVPSALPKIWRSCGGINSKFQQHLLLHLVTSEVITGTFVGRNNISLLKMFAKPMQIAL